MTTLVTRAKKSRVLRPVFAAAASALLLAGCNAAAPSTDTGATSSSSVSSADAMMRRDDDSSDEGIEAMERTEDDDDGMMKASSSSSAAAMMKTSSSAATGMQSHIYKNGAYSADGTYRSPAGGESVTISLTLKDDVVTATSFQGHATAPKSVVMQDKFSAGFQELVVGKNIDELSLTVVNGSSLTGAGFMDAVAKIKAEAKA